MKNENDYLAFVTIYIHFDRFKIVLTQNICKINLKTKILNTLIIVFSCRMGGHFRVPYSVHPSHSYVLHPGLGEVRRQSQTRLGRCIRWTSKLKLPTMRDFHYSNLAIGLVWLSQHLNILSFFFLSKSFSLLYISNDFPTFFITFLGFFSTNLHTIRCWWRPSARQSSPSPSSTSPELALQRRCQQPPGTPEFSRWLMSFS